VNTGQSPASPRSGDKSPDAFRTISEVAQDLDLPQHVLRFWESRFAQIKPLKRGGGRRYYRPDDVDLLKGVRHLLYGKGYTIKGVQRILKEDGLRFVQAIGRGEQSVPAPALLEREEGDNEERDDDHFLGQDSDNETMLDETLPASSNSASSKRQAGASSFPNSLPLPDFERLQHALSELAECERLLDVLFDAKEA
jgi:DNA-binding transcriptional MerR regulator